MVCRDTGEDGDEVDTERSVDWRCRARWKCARSGGGDGARAGA